MNQKSFTEFCSECQTADSKIQHNKCSVWASAQSFIFEKKKILKKICVCESCYLANRWPGFPTSAHCHSVSRNTCSAVYYLQNFSTLNCSNQPYWVSFFYYLTAQCLHQSYCTCGSLLLVSVQINTSYLPTEKQIMRLCISYNIISYVNANKRLHQAF